MELDISRDHDLLSFQVKHPISLLSIGITYEDTRNISRLKLSLVKRGIVRGLSK